LIFPEGRKIRPAEGSRNWGGGGKDFLSRGGPIAFLVFAECAKGKKKGGGRESLLARWEKKEDWPHLNAGGLPLVRGDRTTTKSVLGKRGEKKKGGPDSQSEGRHARKSRKNKRGKKKKKEGRQYSNSCQKKEKRGGGKTVR